MPLPAIISSALAMISRSGAATATGARVAATANAESSFLSKASPAQRKQFDLNKKAEVAEANSRQLNHQLLMLSNGFEKCGTASGKLVGTMAGAAKALDAMAAPIKAMVAINNPAKAKMFELAMADAYGVVGRQLLPVMDAFTRTARKVGNTMAAFEPIMEPLMKSVEGLVDKLGDGFGETMKELAPEIDLAIDALSDYIDMMGAVAKAASENADQMRLFTSVPQIVGRALRDEKKMNRPDWRRTSMNASGNEARFVAPKQIADDAIKSALMMGDQDTKQEKLMKQGNFTLEKIEELLRAQGINPKDVREKEKAEQKARDDSARRFLTG